MIVQDVPTYLGFETLYLEVAAHVDDQEVNQLPWRQPQLV